MLTERQKYAATLALTIERVKGGGEPTEAQKAALRALAAQADLRSATFRMYDGILTVDGEQVAETPYMTFLAQRLSAHSIVELVIARHAEPTELLALTRGLAADGGQGRIKERLRDVSSGKVMVIIERPEDVAGRANRAGVTGAFQRLQLDEAALAEWNKFLSHAAQHAEDHEVKLALPEQPLATHAAGPPPAPPPAGVRESRYEMPRPSLPQPATLQAASPLGIALARLLGDPYGADALPKLTQLSRQLEDAFKHDRAAEAIDALNAVIDLENGAPSEQARNSYSVILRRQLTGATLAQVAPYLLEPRRAHRAQAVLRRGGDAGVDLLVGLLAAAGTVGERLIYLEVLRALPRGVDRVVALLSRGELHLVRGVAELAGEGRLEEAVPYLARFVEHDDERLRRTALVALARIGTVGTVEPVRRALREGAPELRALVAGAVGGPHARALTSLLVAAVEGEDKAELVREYCRALGRIGTPEAVKALEKAAAPGGKVLGRKPASLRIAAVEGLQAAGAAAALEGLARDADRAVREAAQRGAAALASAGPPPT